MIVLPYSEVELLRLSLDDAARVVLHEPTSRLIQLPAPLESNPGRDGWRRLTRKEIARLEIALDYLQTPTHDPNHTGVSQLAGYWEAIAYLKEAGFWQQIYQDVLLMAPHPGQSFTLHERLYQLNNFAEQLQLYQDLQDALGTEAASLSLHGRGRAYYYQAQFQSARVCYEQLLHHAQQQGDRQAEVWALEGLALVYFGQDRRTDAVWYAEQLLERVQRMGDRLRLAQSFRLLGRCYNTEKKYRQGFRRALVCYQQALELLQTEADPNLQGLVLVELTGVCVELRQMRQATRHADQYLNLSGQVEDDYTRIQGYIYLGKFYTVKRQFEAAKDSLLLALQNARRKGVLLAEVLALQLLGASLARDNQFQQAAPYFLQALPLLQRFHQLDAEMVCRCNLSFCYSRLGQTDRAKAEALRAIALSRRLDYSGLPQAMSLMALAAAYWYGGQRWQGLMLLPRIIFVFLQYSHWDNARMALVAIAEVLMNHPSKRRRTGRSFRG